MAKIYIDPSQFIEAICELAENATWERIDRMGGLYIEDDGSTSYTDDAQIVFNTAYDEIEEIINRVLKVYQNDGRTKI